MTVLTARGVPQPIRKPYLFLLVAMQVLLVVVVLGGTLLWMRDLRDEALSGHLRQTSLEVRGFEDQISQNLHLVSLMLANLPNLLADPGLGKIGSHGSRLEKIVRQVPALRSLSIATEDGRIVTSSSVANVGVRLDVSGFLPLMDDHRGDVMRFGLPQEGRDFDSAREANPDAPVGQRANYFLPAVQALSGSRGLMAVAAINPDYFLNHMANRVDADLGHVALFDFRGVTSLTTWDGHQPGSAIQDEKLLRLARDVEIGSIPEDLAHGNRTLTVYRALRSYPFFLVAHIDREAALAKWREETTARLLMVGVALAAILVITSLLTLRLRASFVRESRLQEGQRLAASVFAHSHDGILVTDSETTVVAVNPAFTEITGYAPEDILGKTPRLLSSGQHAVEFYTAMWQRIISTGGWQGEIVNRRKDGGEITEWLTISSICNPEGAVTNYVGVFKDVSKMRESERTIRQLSMAVEQSPSSIVITTPEPAIVYVNPHFTAATGYLPEEVIGQNPRILQSKLTPVETYRVMWEHLLAGENWEGEFVNRRKDGGIYYEHATVAPIKDMAGKTTHYVAVKYDISEQKRLERELIHARELAETASIAKSRFLATMSHEIRTPMNGILGMAQLLLMPSLSENERHEYARIILNSGQSLLTLLNDILDLSKIEAGKVELASVVFQPGQLLHESAALFEELVQAKGLRLETEWLAGDNARYHADSNRLRQMLTNLISNAVKFTRTGCIRIEGREIEASAKDSVLEFSVTDSGIGIPTEKLASLFKPFSQVDASTTREYGGTGLGLSIVRNLALLMRGDVGVESEPGKGSRFWFRIHAERAPSGEDGRLVSRDPAPPISESRAQRFVLVVEDNLTSRLVIESIFKKRGVRCESVENGSEALDRIMAGLQPDLVLMDCQMPVMDGFEATRRIRAWEQENGKARLPVVALTAGAYEEDREQCLAAGMDEFLTKPVDVNTLITTLGRFEKSILV